MKQNERFAREFANKYNGEIVGVIYGNKIIESGRSHAGYKIKINNKYMVYHYYFKTWYRKYDGITISTEQLDQAIEDNALILQHFEGRIEYCCPADTWESLAKQDGSYYNHSQFGTTEVLCKRAYLQELDIEKHGWDYYYSNETPDVQTTLD